MQYIPDIWAFDYVLGLLFLIIIYFTAFVYKTHKMESNNEYQYFVVALSTKIFGAFGFMFLSLYYWGAGDTFTYYAAADGFTDLMIYDPIEALKLILSHGKNVNWNKYEFAIGNHRLLGESVASFTMVKITAIINLFCFKSYVVTTIIFSILSFFGVWNMYFVFCKLYPHLKKILLLAFFFIPSVILWGSGILKDTITISAIGWLVYSFINIILLNRKKTLSLALVVISTLTLFLLKPYILYVLYPALFIWFQSDLEKIISNKLMRKLLAPFIAVLIFGSAYFLTTQLSTNAGKYNINKIESTLEGFQSWHTTVNETKNQSGYSFGEMDFSTRGILTKLPAAVNVTFFRPYFWEVRNSATLLAAIEALVITLFSLFLLLRYRFKLFQIIYGNKDIMFLLIFALVFGAIVGISSYNFGALSRYKMPAQIFYVLALIIIYDKAKKRG